MNEALVDEPGLINKDPMENWIIKVTIDDPAELDNLLDEAAYAGLCH